MLKIALAQINPTVGNLSKNSERILEYVDRAQKGGADLVIFPEMAVCGYPPEDLLHKDHFLRDNIKVIRSLAKKIKGITAIVGFVDRDKAGNSYNAAAIISNRTIEGIYHKQELPNYGVFDEKRYFTPGVNDGIFMLKGNRIGVSICEDIWVEDGICHKQAKSGTKLLVNLSCSPYEVGKFREREKLLKKCSKKTGCAIAYVNLVGGQDELVFDGGSCIVSSDGSIVAGAKAFGEDLVIANVDLGASSCKKGQIAKRLSSNQRIYQALVLGTRDYVQKNGFTNVVLGLSGGIDSALVATIAVDALGKDSVIGVTMPSRYTSKGTKSDAYQLAKNLGIRLIEKPIEEIFKIYLDQLSAELKGTKPGLAEENLQARIRGDILMTFSNKFGWMVLTTGNKSEMAVGYCTLYGDMIGGFAVIKDVPKTKVYELARLRNQEKNIIIPLSTIERAPSAELRANQKDEDSLPSYDVLDEILKGYVEKHDSLKKMSRNNDLEVIKEVLNLVDRSEYKRRQAPPGIKITPRAFGKDWRLPITNQYREF